MKFDDVRSDRITRADLTRRVDAAKKRNAAREGVSLDAGEHEAVDPEFEASLAHLAGKEGKRLDGRGGDAIAEARERNAQRSRDAWRK